MKRLIDADRLLTDRIKSKYYHLPNGDTAIPIIDIEHAPTVDAVEVVRCKDCLMTKERDQYTGKVWCCRHREYMDYMYYCADGLRREDGEEE